MRSRRHQLILQVLAWAAAHALAASLNQSVSFDPVHVLPAQQAAQLAAQYSLKGSDPGRVNEKRLKVV